MRVTRPNRKEVRVWPEGAQSSLNDCFDITDWDIFKDAATYNHTEDIEEYTGAVTAYISKCTDDITHR